MIARQTAVRPGNRWRWVSQLTSVAPLLLAACDTPTPVAEEPLPTVEFREGDACGNGVIDSDEQCDLGFANAVDGRCRPDCMWPRCGDGVQDHGEQCDDGNDDDADGCRSDCTTPLAAQWVRMPPGGSRPETIHDLAAVDRGVVVAGVGDDGTSQRAWLARYSEHGELRWQRWLPGDPAWSSAAATAVAVDAEGDVWAAGHAEGEHDDDVWVARFDAEGQLRWEYFEDLGGNRDQVHALALHGEGVAVAGDVVRSPTDRDGFVLGLDGDGQRTSLWRHDGPAGGLDDARAVAATEDGGLVVGGGEDNLTGWWLAKLDDEGVPLGYSRGSGELGAWISAVVVGDDGDLWVAGTEVLAAQDLGDPSTWLTQPFAARFDPAGQLRWQQAVPPARSARRQAHGITLGPDGGAMVVGTDPIVLATCTRRYCPGRMWLARFDGEGQRLYEYRPALMARGEGRAAAFTEDGVLWLGGSRRVVFTEPDAWLGRYRETAPGATP